MFFNQYSKVADVYFGYGRILQSLCFVYCPASRYLYNVNELKFGISQFRLLWIAVGFSSADNRLIESIGYYISFTVLVISVVS